MYDNSRQSRLDVEQGTRQFLAVSAEIDASRAQHQAEIVTMAVAVSAEIDASLAQYQAETVTMAVAVSAEIDASRNKYIKWNPCVRASTATAAAAGAGTIGCW